MRANTASTGIVSVCGQRRPRPGPGEDYVIGEKRRIVETPRSTDPLIHHDDTKVTIAAMGAMMTEAVEAAERLTLSGIPTDVVCITSPGLLFRAVQARQGRGSGETWILDQLFPRDRATPLLTVLDGHPHTLAFLSGINRVRHTALGVTQFGQVGSLDDVYRYHSIDTDSIMCAALDPLIRLTTPHPKAHPPTTSTPLSEPSWVGGRFGVAVARADTDQIGLTREIHTVSTLAPRSGEVGSRQCHPRNPQTP
jgi:hypothetical protein